MNGVCPSNNRRSSHETIFNSVSRTGTQERVVFFLDVDIDKCVRESVESGV